MKFVISSIVVLCIAQIAIAAPFNQKKDLSSILNLLPHGDSSKPTGNNNLMWGLLGSLTNGTDLHTAMQIMQLLGNVHALEGELGGISSSLLNALNQTAGILTGSLNNLTSHVGTTGKRDLSSILNLLPHGDSKPTGNNNLMWGLLGSLTNGTDLHTAMQIMQLLGNVHALEGELGGISSSLVNALNQTAGILTGSLTNLTSHVGTPGKRDLTSILNMLPSDISQGIMNLLNQLPSTSTMSELIPLFNSFIPQLVHSGLSQAQVGALEQVLQTLSTLKPQEVLEMIANFKPLILPGK